MTRHLLEHQCSIDAKYGTQRHQREFIGRMERAQELNPCTKDHSLPDDAHPPSKPAPPTHVSRCYPLKHGRMVGNGS